MGLSIYYSGRIKNADSLPLLVEEIKDISKIYGWKYCTYETCFPNNTLAEKESFQKIYGIHFTPTNCETVCIAFLSNGVMVNPHGVEFFAESTNELNRYCIYNNFVKTQYAGVFIHQLIINLFKYLNDKYFEQFKMDDESHYWETGDENIMREKFQEYDALLDNFILSVETFPAKKGETMTAYFERLLGHVNNLKDRK
ncbi:MAG: hypothetical protein LBO74_10215 [Candidatus Symbiothrix sp.]|nr:hypothetical protein [Candidatus Symbiothrix sp.]